MASQCGGCGRKLACAAANPLGRVSRYWEGGDGCRDTRFMTSKVRRGGMFVWGGAHRGGWAALRRVCAPGRVDRTTGRGQQRVPGHTLYEL